MNATQSRPPTSGLLPVLTIGLLFFIFGFVTWLNGALIPFLQMVCDLNELEALFITFCFYFAYVVMALPMAKILEFTGYKKGMSVGLGLIALGCLLFVPAALSKTFGIFLGAQFVVGTGLTLLQTASNPFIVHLGNPDSAAARIAFMGILNKLAGVLAPVVFTTLVLGDFSHFNQLSLAQLNDTERASQIAQMSSQLIAPYVGMAVALAVLAVMFLRANLPDISMNGQDPQAATSSSIVQFPHLILGAVTLFFYVGVEVIAGDSIGLYGSSIGVENATTLTSYTMAAMVVGYFIGLRCIPRYISQARALSISALLGIGLSICIVVSGNQSQLISSVLWGWAGIPELPNSVTLIALLGLANAMVWPSVWPLALNGLGKHTAKGSAVLIMGIAGGAVIPLLYGTMAKSISAQTAYVVMIPCYLFILYYGVKGHRKTAW